MPKYQVLLNLLIIAEVEADEGEAAWQLCQSLHAIAGFDNVVKSIDLDIYERREQICKS